MSTTPGRISFVIVTHNSGAVIESCLEKICQSFTEPGSEVIIVDNNSSDDSAKIAIKVVSSARIIINSSNLGFAAACNLGAARATGEFLFFVNPDLELDSDSPAQLRSVLIAASNAGAVAGRLRYPDNRFQANCRSFPSKSNLLFSRGAWLGAIFAGKGGYTWDDRPETTAVPAVAGTMMMIRRELFESMDGFDERFFMYMEDTDLCYRLHKGGLRNYFVPEAGAVHRWGRGSTTGQMRRNWMHHISVWNYFGKHHSGFFTYLILPLLLCINLILKTVLPVGNRSRG